MNFTTPQRVQQTIRAGDDAEYFRGDNRRKINDAANCVPPLEPDLAKKMGVKINVNWGELMIALAQAQRQYRRAFWGNRYFFNIGIPLAPPQYQQDWQLFVTDQINGKMRNSLKYFEQCESWEAAVVCHGIGPRIYYSDQKWCCDYIAIEDLRIATDTNLDFENLNWFSVRKSYTPSELADFILKPKTRWKKEAIYQMVKAKRNQNWDFAANSYDWESQPEKFAELIKQDGAYYMGDAVPAFPLWHFYYKDDTNEDHSLRGWYLKVVPAQDAQDADPNQFLWEDDKPVAKKREHLLQCQFGDLSMKAPFKYHAVRSLGFAMLEPTFYGNITRNRLLQHVHDNFNVWLRSNDPAEKARAQVQQFSNFGIVAPGLNIIPKEQRHQIQGDLVEFAMAQMKQLQQEASSTYTSASDTGTSREQTAFETSVKIEQVNAMTSGLLIKSFFYETQNYKEICRRFCIENSEDEDVQEFQKSCEEYGIPKQFLNSARWTVEAITPLGMGNPTLARSAAKELTEFLPQLDPTAQQEAKHEIVLAITNDPRKAARWVPLDKGRGITDGARDAMGMFGTLVRGLPVPIREGLPAIDQIEAMLPLYAGQIDLYTKRNGMCSADEYNGLTTVSNYIKQLVQQVAQDQREKERVKNYMDTLGRLNNEAKALGQRGAEAAQQSMQNGQNGEAAAAQAKLQAMQMQAQAKAQATEMKARQSAGHKEKAFVQDQRRKDATAFADIQRQDAKSQSEAVGEHQKNQVALAGQLAMDKAAAEAKSAQAEKSTAE